jgi:hypothetical protein
LTVAVSASTIARWVKEGHLHRLHRGVYAVGHRNVSLEGRWLAAVLACGPAAALAGISGCQLLGLIRRRWTDAIHVCVPTARSVRWRESSFTGHDRSNLGI